MVRASSRRPCFASSRSETHGRAQFVKPGGLAVGDVDRGTQTVFRVGFTRRIQYQQQFSSDPTQFRFGHPLPTLRRCQPVGYYLQPLFRASMLAKSLSESRQHQRSC
jgi:hypothetical protein